MMDINYVHERVEAVAIAAEEGDEMGIDDLRYKMDEGMIARDEKKSYLKLLDTIENLM